MTQHRPPQFAPLFLPQQSCRYLCCSKPASVGIFSDLLWIKEDRCAFPRMARMRPTVFRCPTTGKLVQHFIAEEARAGHLDHFDSVQCNACGLTHFVNRATGRVLGQKD